MMLCAECPQFDKKGDLGFGICKRWKLSKYERELCNCDPCVHCQHFSAFYDSSTGITDYGCKAEREFPVTEGEKPCPFFRPELSSESLLVQISEWEEDKFWRDFRGEGDE